MYTRAARRPAPFVIESLYLLVGRPPLDPAWSERVWLEAHRDDAPSRRFAPASDPGALERR
jgi:hypothetical protein